MEQRRQRGRSHHTDEGESKKGENIFTSYLGNRGCFTDAGHRTLLLFSCRLLFCFSLLLPFRSDAFDSSKKRVSQRRLFTRCVCNEKSCCWKFANEVSINYQFRSDIFIWWQLTRLVRARTNIHNSSSLTHHPTNKELVIPFIVPCWVVFSGGCVNNRKRSKSITRLFLFFIYIFLLDVMDGTRPELMNRVSCRDNTCEERIWLIEERPIILQLPICPIYVRFFMYFLSIL